MGKLNKEMDLIKNTIDSKKDLNFTSFTKFQESTPIFITYFKQNEVSSTKDEGFENVHSFIGDNSPIVYNRIDNVPLYNVNTAQLELNDDETGIKPGFNSEGVLLPNTFKPIPNDYLIVDYLDKKILFKVTDVQMDSIKSNPYFKIQFKFNRIQNDYNINHQVSDEFKMIYENIGTEDRVIVKNADYKILESLKAIYSELMENYKHIFLSREYNSFLTEFRYGDSMVTLYDKYLTQFIIKNKLMQEFGSNSNLYLNIETSLSRTFNNEYNKTIFGLLESKNIKNGIPSNIQFRYINDMNSMFYGVKETIKEFDYGNTNIAFNYINKNLIKGMIEAVNISMDSCIFVYSVCNSFDSIIFESETIKNSSENEFEAAVYNNLSHSDFDTRIEFEHDDENIVKTQNIIIQYLECYALNNYNGYNQYLLEQINNIMYNIEYNKDYYIMIPIILYIVKDMVNKILIKENK